MITPHSARCDPAADTHVNIEQAHLHTAHPLLLPRIKSQRAAFGDSWQSCWSCLRSCRARVLSSRSCEVSSEDDIRASSYTVYNTAQFKSVFLPCWM
ncbi:hypothetical protein A4X03_0g9113 [Tilletia caries]|uniref:Uncharacterized protein n=1 Tax=Tilletia caries TaxID=13290 RepID=A0A8T8SD35_9BASI|nr:hypothetical protein A4X03_0g9113 [Tilletia caries]